jgi:hypothetical protein
VFIVGAAGCSSKNRAAVPDAPDASHDAGKSDASHTPNHSFEDDEADSGEPGDGPLEDAGPESDGAEDAGPEKEHAVDPCAVADEPDDDFTDSNCDGIDGDKNRAIFVAKTGVDSADGSFERPVATLARGIAIATSKGKDVYACGGEYKESITLESKSVRVYGGYDCTHGWVRNSSSQVQLLSPAGTTLTIRSAPSPVVFDRVDIEAANSSDVTLRRGMYRAGDGAPAQPPADTPAAPPSSVVLLQGENAAKSKRCGVAEDPRPSCTSMSASYTFALSTPDTWNLRQTSADAMYCPAGDYSYGGGGGGTSPADCYNSTAGTEGYPVATSGTLDGVNGDDGASATGATIAYGSLDANGYKASNQGQSGKPGRVGQGGTGGRGGGIFLIGPSCDICTMFEPVPVAGGGQGGPGGCGGLGGAPGNAGGASIAVAVYHSQVTLERAFVQTSRGGGGSRGGYGGEGALGVKGAPAGTVNLCGTIGTDPMNTHAQQAGGNGGNGGHGGQGGPGGGGPSIPLFVAGATPTRSSVTFIPGAGGPGGANGTGPRAQDGESIDQKVLP